MQETSWFALALGAAAQFATAAAPPVEGGLLNALLSALLRGLIASAVLAVVLIALRRGGPRLAGLLAAVPVTSAPALFWLGHDLGAQAAAAAATASLYVTGLTAALALGYGVFAHQLGAVKAGLVALLLTAALATATASFDRRLLLAGSFTVIALLAALRWLPRQHGNAAPSAGLRHEMALTLSVTAALTTLILLLAPLLPARWCGLLAALPVIGIVAAVRVQRQTAPAAFSAFLRAYVSGLFAKAAFLLALAAAPVPLGLPLAWLLACGAALGVVLLARVIARQGGPQPARPGVALPQPSTSTP